MTSNPTTTEDLEDWLAGLESEGDLLYYIRNWPDRIPVELRQITNVMATTGELFDIALENLCDRLGVEND